MASMAQRSRPNCVDDQANFRRRKFIQRSFKNDALK
jgi:hypothetical protein